MASARAPIGSAVLACGGTGGHVYPAVAIARALAERKGPPALSFVGRAASFESAAIERAGFPMDAVAIGRLVGQGIATRLATLAQLPVAVARASRILGRRRPDVVIGTGGFVSGPTVLAAALRRVPIVVLEQNAVTGFTNSVLAALAQRVALAHPQEGRGEPKYHVTGNPVRPEFFDVPPYAQAQPFTLLVLGGSQGARALNAATLDAAASLGDLAGRLRIVLQCGPRWEAESRERAAASAVPVEIAPFLHDVPQRLATASLVLCRSGSTVWELCAAGRPSLLVPLPTSAGDHQAANARALAEAGAAEWFPQAGFTGDVLAARLRKAIAEPATLVTLATRARALARRDAASRVADLAEECAAGRKRGAA